MSDKLPLSIDVQALAEAGTELAAQAPLARFARLLDLAPGTPADRAVLDALGPVHWVARFHMLRVTGAADQPALHLQIDAQLPLQCQRCLMPYAQAVQVDREFAFVKDEAMAEAFDDESDVDLLVASRQFDLAALIEDELLMAMPIVPKHAQCPAPVAMQAGDVDDAPERPNPFAALAALKDKPAGGGTRH
jgi:uncharacterized protein